MKTKQNVQYIVDIKNLEKTFESKSEKLTVLKDLDLQIEYAKKISITGESGNGKSTLLNIIAGIDTATSGSVICGNNDLLKMKDEDLCLYRRNFTGLVFQFHYLLKDFTALENIYLPALMAGLSKKQAEEKALDLINEVGLYDRKNHLPGELSGGERQRIAVARSLINDPQLILADEPTGNLDPSNAAHIADLLFSMTDKFNKTLILVTHDLKLAKYADTVYKIKDGKLLKAGSRK